MKHAFSKAKYCQQWKSAWVIVSDDPFVRLSTGIFINGPECIDVYKILFSQSVILFGILFI